MWVLADDFTVGPPLQDFDLSRNKSLRTLEITASTLRVALSRGRPLADMHLFTYALSTIRSPTFSEVVVIYLDYDFGSALQHRCESMPLSRSPSQAEIEEEAQLHHWRFEGFRTMRKVRNFRLMLCVEVWDGVSGYSVQVLKQLIAAEKANSWFGGWFGGLSPEPLVSCRPRRSYCITGPLDPHPEV